MEMRRTERLFERFRAKGDLRALGEVFDRTAPELLALASHLTRELADAEDVLQATFVTAIERAGTWDGERRLVPWLCGILVHHARAAQRRAADHATRAGAPGVLDEHAGAGGDPASDVAAQEVGALVRDALRALPAREREVLERHLVREERAVDIARALGRAPGTVRMQIHRGLERLRRALPPGTMAGLLPALAPRGRLAPRGSAALREAVVAHARAHVAHGAGSALSLAVLTIGGGLVSTKLLFSALGVCGVAALGWLLFGGTPDGAVGELARSGLERASAAELVLAPTRTAEAREVVPDAVRPASEPAHAAAAPAGRGQAPGWYIVGRVSGLRDGDDPRDVSMNAYCLAARTQRIVGARARADGTFELDVTPIVQEVGARARELLVSANHPLYVSGNALAQPAAADLARAAHERTEWIAEPVLARASGVRGRVVLPGGGPGDDPGDDPGDVELCLFPVDAQGRVAGAGREIGCEEDGTYDMRWLEHGDFGLVAHARGRLPAGLVVAIPRETIVAVPELVLAAGDVAIEGRIVFPAGRSAVGSVWAERDDGFDRVASVGWDGRHAAPAAQRASYDEHGRFRIEGLSPGRWNVSCADIEGVLRLARGGFIGSAAEPEPAVGPHSIEVEAPAVGVVLQAGTAWLDVVATADGAPLADARVEVVAADGGMRVDATTTSTGRLVFLAEEAGTLVVSVEKAGHERATRTLTVDAGREHLTVFDLARSATGSLVIEADEALCRELPSLRVELERTGAGDEPLELVLDLAGGTARVDGLAAGRWSVAVEPDEGSFGPYYESYRGMARFEVDIAAGASVRRALDLPLGGRARIAVEGFDEGVESLSVRLLGPDGAPLHARFVRRSYAGNVLSVGTHVGAIAAHGTSTLYPNLPPGLYQLVPEHEGWSIEPVAFTIVAGECVDVRVGGERR